MRSITAIKEAGCAPSTQEQALNAPAAQDQQLKQALDLNVSHRLTVESRHADKRGFNLQHNRLSTSRHLYQVLLGSNRLCHQANLHWSTACHRVYLKQALPPQMLPAPKAKAPTLFPYRPHPWPAWYICPEEPPVLPATPEKEAMDNYMNDSLAVGII